jgi:uncharacterized protein
MNQITHSLAPEVEIVEPAMLVKVDRRFRPDMSADELYEITRGDWLIEVRRNKAQYAFCVYQGIVQQVYEIQRWSLIQPSTQEADAMYRWRFSGAVAQDLQKYVGRNVEKYVKTQNPIRYVNC